MRKRKDLNDEIYETLYPLLKNILTKSPQETLDIFTTALRNLFRERERLAYMKGLYKGEQKYALKSTTTNTDPNSGS